MFVEALGCWHGNVWCCHLMMPYGIISWYFNRLGMAWFLTFFSWKRKSVLLIDKLLMLLALLLFVFSFLVFFSSSSFLLILLLLLLLLLLPLLLLLVLLIWFSSSWWCLEELHKMADRLRIACKGRLDESSFFSLSLSFLDSDTWHEIQPCSTSGWVTLHVITYVIEDATLSWRKLCLYVLEYWNVADQSLPLLS